VGYGSTEARRRSSTVAMLLVVLTLESEVVCGQCESAYPICYSTRSIHYTIPLSFLFCLLVALAHLTMIFNMAWNCFCWDFGKETSISGNRSSSFFVCSFYIPLQCFSHIFHTPFTSLHPRGEHTTHARKSGLTVFLFSSFTGLAKEFVLHLPAVGWQRASDPRRRLLELPKPPHIRSPLVIVSRRQNSFGAIRGTLLRI
jgi:hypothetical protein